MHATIYGRPGCGFCTRARQIAEYLKKHRDDFEFTYIDMYSAGLSKHDIAKKTGHPAPTVPQIMLDERYVGGCTEFEALATQELVPRPG